MSQEMKTNCVRKKFYTLPTCHPPHPDAHFEGLQQTFFFLNFCFISSEIDFATSTWDHFSMRHENLITHRRRKLFYSLIIYSYTWLCAWYSIFLGTIVNYVLEFLVKHDKPQIFIFSPHWFSFPFMPDFMNLMRRREANFSSEINETVIFVICNWVVCNPRSLFIAISIFIQFIRFKRQSKSTHNSNHSAMGVTVAWVVIIKTTDGAFLEKKERNGEKWKLLILKNGKMLD